MTSIVSETKNLLKRHEPTVSFITAIEVKLIQKFIEIHNLELFKESTASKLIEKHNNEASKVLPSNLFEDIEDISTDDLVYTFEMLVPEKEAKEYGAFFTPHAITSFMAEELLESLHTKGFDLQTVKILDPAVGCGALLVATAHKLAEKTNRTFAECSHQLTGTDLSTNSIQRARILFELIALKEGNETLPSPNLKVENGLQDVTSTYDGIIANPPYVRYQVMNDELRETLKTDWETCRHGNYNLYFAFMEKTHKVLAKNGSAYFITPNGFIDSKSGIGLRQWVETQKNLESIIDFGKHKVFDVLTYTAITHFEKKVHKDISYVKIAGIKGLEAYKSTVKTSYPYVSLSGGASWNFTDDTEKSIVAKVLGNPTPLTDVFDVRYGLATLRDKLFSFRSTLNNGFYTVTFEGIEYKVEEAFTRKCVKVSGLRSQEDIANDDLRIIYPYIVQDSTAVPMSEEYVQTMFPEGYKYLLAIRKELLLRDKGKKTYPTWFSYGRTQGLIPVQNKLLTPLYLIQPRFMLDTTGSLFLNGCALVLKEGAGITLEEAQKFLNTDDVKDFMLATSKPIDGGFVAYQKTQLGRLRLP